MNFRILPGAFAICKVAKLPSNLSEIQPVFLAVTAEEISLVCPEQAEVENVLKREDGWRGFFIDGILDFSLIGVLAAISKVLSQEKIGIFVLSTYNTDYIFVKEENFAAAVTALKNHGYSFDR